MLPSCFLCRPPGDGGPYDVLTSLPGNSQFGSRRLEAPCLEVWLGLLVSAHHLLSFSPLSQSTFMQLATCNRMLALCPCAFSSSLILEACQPHRGQDHQATPILSPPSEEVEWILLASFVRALCSVSADKAQTASPPDMCAALGK